MREDKISVFSRTRRDILKGRIASKNHHIASVLVQAWPNKIPTIESALTRLAGVESHGSSDAGKLILTLEAENNTALVETMNRIEMVDGVVTASLVYHHTEEMDDAHETKPNKPTSAQLTRRDYIKANAVVAAAAAAGMPLAAMAAQLPTASQTTELKWSKAPCRFCGVGCSVMVATKEGRLVATHGDVHSPVNRGLNCVKGYFLSKIMYGQDRLTQPLLRLKNGKYDKNGEFTPVSWDLAFDRPRSACSGPGNGLFGKGMRLQN